jgi:hypothetical protein
MPSNLPKLGIKNNAQKTSNLTNWALLLLGRVVPTGPRTSSTVDPREGPTLLSRNLQIAARATDACALLARQMKFSVAMRVAVTTHAPSS